MSTFTFHPEDARKPIVFEQVFAELPGGGVVASLDHDIPAGTAVGLTSDGYHAIIKSYVTASSVGSSDANVKLVKGSGIAEGDFIAYGNKAVAVTAVDKSNPDYDVATATMGVTIPQGALLYQAKAASASAAAPALTPLYVTGDVVPANSGNVIVRLVNGANLRKETANVAPEVVAHMKSIALV